jgi:HD-GYP domain-containing protein (c-di-GMP phosphodiesterase class II)
VILKGEILGVLEAVNKTAGAKFTEADKQLFGILANQIAIVVNNAKISEDQQNFFTNSIEIFVKAIESVGVMMGLMSQGHCWRVAELSTVIGSDFDISGPFFDDLYYGAVLHDIGILEQQQNEFILFDSFQEQWDEGAWGKVQSHPIAGANIIKNINLLRGVVPIIRHHHEHFDGTGYPDGLKGDNIPLGARIVAVAEVYEEMLLGSLKSESELHNIAIEGIQKSSGTILDPLIVDIFLSVIGL